MLKELRDYKIILTPTVKEDRDRGINKIYNEEITFHSFEEAMNAYQQLIKENLNSKRYDSVKMFRAELHEINNELSFGQALEELNNGKKLTRLGWKRPDFWIELQTPDEHSKMTKPYLYMVKNGDRFPTDLSCESILANDWYIVE